MMQTWPIRTKIQKNIVFVQKPSGMNTHRPDLGKKGLAELLSDQIGQAVDPLHRLDKETSGIIIFSLDKKITAQMAELFENHKVKKKYLFLTDRKVSAQTYRVQSEIEKKGSAFLSKKSHRPNAHTEFNWKKSIGNFELWEALPQTGKPHQIRLHAQDIGIPILGDNLHGGSPFFRLALHSAEITWQLDGENYSETSQPWFAESWLTKRSSEAKHNNRDRSPSLHRKIDESVDLSEIRIAHWKEAFWNRTCFLKVEPKMIGHQVFRWSHRESEDFRVDQYGDRVWVYWYAESPPAKNEPVLNAIQTQLQKELWIRQMKSRGTKDDQQAFLIHYPLPNNQQNFQTLEKNEMPSSELNAPGLVTPNVTEFTEDKKLDFWTAQENSILYQLRPEQGLSAGLFLDQRENRKWVRSESQGKRVLNLFSYTGGFSLCAALGGAHEVTTVDVSKNFIEWSKENFKLNHLEEKKEYQFWVQDSLLFLKSCEKRQRNFDLIICDPPTLGRSREGTFDLKRDWGELLARLWTTLAPNGKILFCFNFEGWTLDDFQKKILSLNLQKSILEPNGSQTKNKYKLEIKSAPGNPYDFDWDENKALMKSIILEKTIC